MSDYQVMPELTAEEYAELKVDIAQRGVMVPIEYDEQGNILDGYHRLKICGELGIKDFPKVIRAGMTEVEKLTHARKLNMARRQLTGDQKRELIRDQLKATPEQSDRQIAKALGVSHVTVGSQRRELESIGQIDQSSRCTKDGRIYPATRKPPVIQQDDTVSLLEHGDGEEIRPCDTGATDPAEKIAEIIKAAIHRNTKADEAKIVSADPTPLAPSDPTISFTEPIVRKPVSVFNPTKREERAVKKPEVVERMQKDGISPLVASMKVLSEAKAERKTYELSEDFPEEMCNLFVADIRSGLKEIEDGSVDAIITDPPYPREYIPLYGELSRVAQRVLKPNGSLLVMTGQSYLPEVIEHLGQYMMYHWTMCYLTPGGQSPQMFQKRVNTFWKPVLWYVKGGYTGDYVGDVLKSPVNANEKDYHEWGQSLGGMIDIIERLTNPGDLILDPFLGGGTTGVAAVSMGRRFIGSDIDSKNVNVSQQRIEEAYTNAGSKAGENVLA